MPSSGLTIKDVARAAGVSLGTASNVISGHRRVSTELRDRVEAAIAQLGYKPNAIAASLRRKQTRTVGLILPSLQNTFFVEVADALEDLVVADGYEVIMAVTKESPERTITHIRTLAARRVDGIMAIPTIESSLALNELRTLAHPTVIIDRIEDENDFPTVAIQNREAGRLGTEHLLSLGHTKIAFIVNSDNLTNGRNRVAGFWDAVTHAKVEARCQTLVVGMTDEDAYQHVLALLQSPDRPTALFTLSNLATIGALRAIQAIGLRIPNDISILAFDDPEFLRVFRPFVSAIRQPTHRIAEESWRLMKRQLADATVAPEHVRLPVEVLIRDSTAPLGAGALANA